MRQVISARLMALRAQGNAERLVHATLWVGVVGAVVAGIG